MDKYRLVEERIVGASGFRSSSRSAGRKSSIGDDDADPAGVTMDTTSGTGGTITGTVEESKTDAAADATSETDPESEGVVQVTQHAKPRNCITAAMNMLASDTDRVTLKAMGKAINKAVTIAEILKRKMPLHQTTSLGSCEIINVYEPLEEGLGEVVNRHYMSCVTIDLCKSGEGVDHTNIGYQPPLPQDEIQPGDFNVLQPPHHQQQHQRGRQVQQQQQAHSHQVQPYPAQHQHQHQHHLQHRPTQHQHQQPRQR